MSWIEVTLPPCCSSLISIVHEVCCRGSMTFRASDSTRAALPSRNKSSRRSTGELSQIPRSRRRSPFISPMSASHDNLGLGPPRMPLDPGPGMPHNDVGDCHVQFQCIFQVSLEDSTRVYPAEVVPCPCTGFTGDHPSKPTSTCKTKGCGHARAIHKRFYCRNSDTIPSVTGPGHEVLAEGSPHRLPSEPCTCPGWRSKDRDNNDLCASEVVCGHARDFHGPRYCSKGLEEGTPCPCIGWDWDPHLIPKPTGCISSGCGHAPEFHTLKSPPTGPQ